ncbi:MAG: PilZ domain-containing protein [Erythrobacter sp.]|uniref:PilZ domain-containing protein n=1 Tax=Erythrobacter sp. TaxID=1042 RepID=UPI003C747A79
MSGVDTRSESRDSFFLLANISAEDGGDPNRVRVRNLSDGGMMGEGDVAVRRGERVTVQLGSVGSMGATIAWVQGRRFGVAFDSEIDSERARRPVVASGGSDDDRRVAWYHKAKEPADPARLRKV